ncbi:glycosyltransferase 87 family protein [Tersicoccus sp. MR15.9]|uniref:glycosyltransferase 87 family protein n=1 Tax=Tersicoccus mangrovi TaxID=3121635 RepID=UPI002FE5CD39
MDAAEGTTTGDADARPSAFPATAATPWLLVATAVVGVSLAGVLYLAVDRMRLVGLVPGATAGNIGGADVSMILTSIAWALFLLAGVLASRCLRRVSAGLGWAVVLGGGILIALAVLSAPPSTSNDSARYAWDGIVQRAGISPFAHVPADPALASLRPDWLVGPQLPGGGCDPTRFPSDPNVQDGLCFAINRPTVPTIYPPVAELYFFLVRMGVPAEVGFIALQVAGAVLVVGVTVVLLRLLGRGRRDRALWWAWCPAVAMEGINNAHVDLLAAVLLLPAVLLLARGRVTTSAVAFGAAVATKVLPVLAAVGLLYRRPVRFVLVAAATVVVSYVPYVLWSGADVLGFLPGYLREEGYSSGGQSTRFALLTTVLPTTAAGAAGIAIVAVLAALLWWRWGRRAPTGDGPGPWDAQCLFLGLALLVVSPTYPWYTLMIVPLAVLTGRWESLGVPLALTVMYNFAIADDRLVWARGATGAALVVLVVVTALRISARRRTARRSAERGSEQAPGLEAEGLRVLEGADDDGAARAGGQ